MTPQPKQEPASGNAPKVHEESGCTDYLQHSWVSCPENPLNQITTYKLPAPEVKEGQATTTESGSLHPLVRRINFVNTKLSHLKLKREHTGGDWWRVFRAGSPNITILAGLSHIESNDLMMHWNSAIREIVDIASTK